MFPLQTENLTAPHARVKSDRYYGADVISSSSECTSISQARSANTLWRSSDVDVDDGVRFYRYLRFYPDGTVIGVTSCRYPPPQKKCSRDPVTGRTLKFLS